MGRKITLTKESINTLLHTPNVPVVHDKKESKLEDYAQVFLDHPERPIVIPRRIPVGPLPLLHRIYHLIITGIITPHSGGTSYVSSEELHILAGLIRGDPMNLGYIILNSIRLKRTHPSHAILITRILRSYDILPPAADTIPVAVEYIGRRNISGLNIVKYEDVFYYTRGFHPLSAQNVRVEPFHLVEHRKTCGVPPVAPPTAPPPAPHTGPSAAPSTTGAGPSVTEVDSPSSPTTSGPVPIVEFPSDPSSASLDQKLDRVLGHLERLDTRVMGHLERLEARVLRCETLLQGLHQYFTGSRSPAETARSTPAAERPPEDTESTPVRSSDHDPSLPLAVYSRKRPRRDF